ncbi:hypothetical protein GCM10007276_01810 [Agaricicola taiwanensis]|uniref:HTH marR-type domain-containing protein n=1 Tax=Agaricicola taiwanensis TaxID=591372 RepID=A0A8J2VF86_9RHOB|nr:MarR family transcriptional regulator [Agaricicola taiwanensis]GGE28259.1 hypothetical protein GCM10007276_01810 [Agaricicola taiwanensis]
MKDSSGKMPLQSTTRDALLPGGSDADFREMLHNTLAFASRIQNVRDGFASLLGLSGAQFTILMAVRRLQGSDGIGVNALAEHLHLSGAFVTIEVNKLVAQNLINKRPHPEDKRRVRLTLSEEGSLRLTSLLPVQAPVNDALFASLTAEEFKTFHSIMKRLVQHGDEALALLSFYMAKTGTES